VGKNWPKNVGCFGNLKNCPKNQTPKGRKFAQSSHPASKTRPAAKNNDTPFKT
jgi:hypothetical protein